MKLFKLDATTVQFLPKMSFPSTPVKHKGNQIILQQNSYNNKNVYSIVMIGIVYSTLHLGSIKTMQMIPHHAVFNCLMIKF